MLIFVCYYKILIYTGHQFADVYLIFKSEFTKRLPYPKTTGYIEFVGVIATARDRGIAKEILSEIIKHSKHYNEFILDVMDNNI